MREEGAVVHVFQLSIHVFGPEFVCDYLSSYADSWLILTMSGSVRTVSL